MIIAVHNPADAAKRIPRDCWRGRRTDEPPPSATDPRRSGLVDLAWIAGSRWRVEECLQQAKNEAGLDHYQVRTYGAWYAHSTLSMLALAWLAAVKAQATKGAVTTTMRA